ncbi:MAG: hypothetical protein BMS9Abin37_2591 [Acidobacteriota bacterium]|nr:MAG: hypothetical protein BMS9Abin37_2591 [Acidobacteriota bacterium]
MRTATTTAFVFCLFVGASASTFAQHPDFSGRWLLNEKLSQDPLEKIHHALGTEEKQGASTRGSNSVSNSVLLRDTDLRETLLSLMDYAEVLEIVEIEQDENEITISVGEDDRFFSLFYLDGQKHAREMQAGLRIEATAAWEGESIHIVQIGENKAVLKEIYSLVGDGDQLALIFILESKLSQVPIQFRVVYDRVRDD